MRRNRFIIIYVLLPLILIALIYGLSLIMKGLSQEKEEVSNVQETIENFHNYDNLLEF